MICDKRHHLFLAFDLYVSTLSISVLSVLTVSGRSYGPIPAFLCACACAIAFRVSSNSPALLISSIAAKYADGMPPLFIDFFLVFLPSISSYTIRYIFSFTTEYFFIFSSSSRPCRPCTSIFCTRCRPSTRSFIPFTSYQIV